MIVHGAAIHRDGHGKCGLLATQTFLHSLPGLAAPLSAFSQNCVSANPTGISLNSSPRINARIAISSCPAREEERRGL